jgi:dedicator of cytokinesis protein 3
MVSSSSLTFWQKRRAIWRLVGDVRGQGAAILLNLWQALGSSEHVTTTGEPPIRYGVRYSSFH